MAQPICPGLLAVQSRLLTVTDHSLAIGYRSSLGGDSSVSASTLAIGGGAHRDLSASSVARAGAERRQRAIAQRRGPIALEPGEIARVGHRVSAGSRGDASRDGSTSLARPSLAQTAQTAAETYATENAGKYSFTTPKQLQEIEPSINYTKTSEADLTVAKEIGGAGEGYEVTAKAQNTGDEYTIKRLANGTLEHLCTSSATQKGCPGHSTSSSSW